MAPGVRALGCSDCRLTSTVLQDNGAFRSGKLLVKGFKGRQSREEEEKNEPSVGQMAAVRLVSLYM